MTIAQSWHFKDNLQVQFLGKKHAYFAMIEASLPSHYWNNRFLNKWMHNIELWKLLIQWNFL